MNNRRLVFLLSGLGFFGLVLIAGCATESSGESCDSACKPAGGTASVAPASFDTLAIDGISPANINDVDRTTRFDAAVKGLSFADGRMSVRAQYAVARDPSASRAAVALARSAYDANEINVAIVHLANAFRLDDKNPDAAYWMARTLTPRGKTDERIAAATTAVELAPASADARYELGMAHWAKGDQAAAKRALNETIAIDPAYGPALERLAVAAYYDRDVAAARAFIARAKAAGQPVPPQLEAQLDAMQ